MNTAEMRAFIRARVKDSYLKNSHGNGLEWLNRLDYIALGWLMQGQPDSLPREWEEGEQQAFEDTFMKIMKNRGRKPPKEKRK